MVEIRINGKAAGREFRNMGQALAFAANNGECVNAETLAFAYVKAGANAKSGSGSGGSGDGSGGNGSGSGSGGVNKGGGGADNAKA
jgi:hypothetical protein